MPLSSSWILPDPVLQTHTVPCQALLSGSPTQSDVPVTASVTVPVLELCTCHPVQFEHLLFSLLHVCSELYYSCCNELNFTFKPVYRVMCSALTVIIVFTQNLFFPLILMPFKMSIAPHHLLYVLAIIFLSVASLLL